MVKHQMIRSAAVLGLSGVLAKSFDFAFRAYYSRSLGTEGMGLLSLVFGIHGVMVTVATAGLGVAVSKIVSEYLEKGKWGMVRQSMRLALYGVSCISLMVILLTIVFSEFIAIRFLGDKRVSLGLCCLVPSILFMGLSYCLKGYFYAARKVWIPASSELLEQAIKFISISTLLRFWLPLGVQFGCAAVFTGISIGELSSCIYLSFFYYRAACKMPKSAGTKGILRSILAISVPSMISSFVGSTLRMQEEVWIVAGFERYGLSHENAISQLGIIHGMVMPLIVFPLTLTGSVTTLLVPEIARAAGMKDKRRLHTLIIRIAHAGCLAGGLVMLGFVCFGDQITQIVYHNTQIAPMVKQLSALAPVMFLDSFACAVLNGLGKQFSMLSFNLMDSFLRLTLIVLAVPQIGMQALVLMIVISNLFTCIMTTSKVIRSAQFRFPKRQIPHHAQGEAIGKKNCS